MLSPTHPSGSSPISSSPLAGVRVVAASCDTTGDGSTNVVVQWQENFVVAASSVSVSNATNTVIYKVYMYYLRLQELASTSPGPRPLVALDNCHVRTSSGNLSLSPTQITNAKVRVMPVPVQCATSPAKLKLY